MIKKTLGTLKLSTRRFLRIEVGFDFKDEADVCRFRGFVVAYVLDHIKEWATAYTRLENVLTIYVCCFFLKLRWDTKCISCMPALSSTV